MTNIRDTIRRLKELHEKATPGEWDNEHPESYRTQDMSFIAEAHNLMPALIEYVERLEKVAEAARRWVSFTIFKEPVVMHPQQLVELLTLAIRDTESALEELDALDSEAFDRRNFTYSNDGRSITILNTDDSYSFDAKDVRIITKP